MYKVWYLIDISFFTQNRLISTKVNKYEVFMNSDIYDDITLIIGFNIVLQLNL